MKTRVGFFRPLSRRAVVALCAGLALSACSASPGVVRAKAMSDAEFVELCWEGTSEQVKQALKDGANPNARHEDGDPALLRAVWNEENPDVLKALLDAGADPNAKNKNGETPLHSATQDARDERDLSAVQALLKAGADPNARDASGRTPLYRPVFRDHLPVVQALLKAGADPNAKDEDGDTALTQSFDSGGDRGCPGPTAKVYKAMLEAGADVNGGCDDGKDGCVTPLVALIRSCNGGDAASIRALLKAGADPNAEDNDGRDALWHARQSGNNEIIRLLEGAAKKPARAKAGAFGPAELKRMSIFVSNFTEVGFPDFDMEKSGADDVLHLGGDPSHPELIRFGIWHNYINNFKSRIKDCPAKGCKERSMIHVIDAKFVAESVRKYFDLTPKHQSFDGEPTGHLSWHFDGKLYHFMPPGGDPVQSAQVKRAVREGGVIRMTGDIHSESDADDRPRLVGAFVVTAKPHKWNGRNTWAILSLKTEYKEEDDR